MVSAGGIENIINNHVKEVLNKKIAKVRVAGNKAMLETRKKIIYEWFSTVTPQLSSNAATEIIGALNPPESHIASRNDKSIVVEFVSYIDGDKYSPDTSSAEKWVSKHGGENPKDWILNLQLKQGIVGLPAYASTYEATHGKPYNAKGWTNGVNEHFHSSSVGLEEYTDNHALWNNFKNEILNNL